MRKRTRARELALQALYQLEIRGEEALEDALNFCIESAEDTEVSQYATQLIEGSYGAKAQIDKKITAVAEHWELPRMATVDRCILRLSIYELLYKEDIPPKVSINEAIELAKKYSTANSGTFVNGVLDKIYSSFCKKEMKGEDREQLLEGSGEADLHVHTICSDGTFTPEEIVREAANVGLKAIAITDHDSIDGIRIAQKFGEISGIYVIPGIELSGYLHPNEIHILGLFIDIEESNLLNKLEEMKRDRVERVSAVLEKLEVLGVHLEAQEVLDLAGNSPPGRMHMAETLYKKGYCFDIQEAFNKYLSDSGPAYVPKKTISVPQAIELILGAGGVPVYTHPGLTMRDDLIPYLVDWGIQGIEVYYPTHTPDQVEKYLQLARKYNLAVAGGSDFHGQRKPSIPLGKVRVPLNLVAALREKRRQKRGVVISR